MRLPKEAFGLMATGISRRDIHTEIEEQESIRIVCAIMASVNEEVGTNLRDRMR